MCAAPDELIVTEKGVKIIGFTNLPSRLPATASLLYGNNAAKFILSAGPTTNKELKKFFYPDYSDPAVRGMLVVDKGHLRWPNPNPYNPPVVSSTTPAAAPAAAPAALVPALQASSTAAAAAPAATAPAAAAAPSAATVKKPKHKSGGKSAGGDPLEVFQSKSRIATAMALLALAAGAASPDDKFSLLLSVFALSSFAGQQVHF